MLLFDTIDPRFMLSGLLVGMLVGQTGVGGGSLMTPLLVLAFGFHPTTAVGTDLLYASATKTVGTLVHGMNKTVDWTIVRRLATGSVPATALTLLAMGWLELDPARSGKTVGAVLGVALLLTAVSLVFRARILGLLLPRLREVSPARTRNATIAVGALLGVLVTISSVGAGALGVTALLLLYPRSALPTIVGSDIAHAVPLTLVAGVGHLFLGDVNVALLISLLSGSIPGVIVGSWYAPRVPELALRALMASVLGVAGLRLVM